MADGGLADTWPITRNRSVAVSSVPAWMTSPYRGAPMAEHLPASTLDSAFFKDMT